MYEILKKKTPKNKKKTEFYSLTKWTGDLICFILSQM